MATSRRKKESKETIFADGIRVFEPHENAPDFVIASVVIDPTEFFSWMKENKDYLKPYKKTKQLNLQLLESKDGEMYFSVNTYGTPSNPEKEKPVSEKRRGKKKEEEEIEEEDDLPF